MPFACLMHEQRTKSNLILQAILWGGHGAVMLPYCSLGNRNRQNWCLLAHQVVALQSNVTGLAHPNSLTITSNSHIEKYQAKKSPSKGHICSSGQFWSFLVAYRFWKKCPLRNRWNIAESKLLSLLRSFSKSPGKNHKAWNLQGPQWSSF